MSDSGFRATGPADLHNEPIDFAMLDPREQLRALLRERVAGKPFSELYAVTLTITVRP